VLVIVFEFGFGFCFGSTFVLFVVVFEAGDVPGASTYFSSFGAFFYSGSNGYLNCSDIYATYSSYIFKIV
jgi:hypothetical protein